MRSSGFTFRSTDVGVVLDLMIHDIDLVLSMVGSPLRKVDALGFSVLGGHEDVANARLEFECGCVATLSASRVSYEQVRRMQVWSAEGFAAIDFAARTATLVRPSETLRRRQFDVDALTPGASRALPRSILPKSTCRRSSSASTPLTPWRWSWTILWSRSAAAASRGSAARRAATPWRWPSRFWPASTPTVGTPRWTARPARWPSPGGTSFPRRTLPRPRGERSHSAVGCVLARTRGVSFRARIACVQARTLTNPLRGRKRPWRRVHKSLFHTRLLS